MEKIVCQYFQKNKQYLQSATPDLDSFYAGIEAFFGDIDYDIFTSIITNELRHRVKPSILHHMTYIPEFYMKNLPNVTDIEIPPSIKEWKMGSFWDCSDIERVTINNKTLKIIGDGAFHGCNKLQSIIIPSNINVISKGAFEDCFSLNHVEFNEGLESIDNYAFDGCKNLKEYKLPKSLSYIGAKALPYGPHITAYVYSATFGAGWAKLNNCRIRYI